MAGPILRMADGYLRLKCSAPGTVVNETYGLVRFDTEGRVERAQASMVAQTMAAALESAARPNAAERGRMRELLFGEPQYPTRHVRIGRCPPAR